MRFARAEGILPAPEANHAVRGAIVEALGCKVEGKAQTILFNLCGHGHFDMQAYIDFLSCIDASLNAGPNPFRDTRLRAT